MTDARAQIAARTKAQREPLPYRFPGTDVPIAIRLLSEEEINCGRCDAMAYCLKKKANLDIDPDFFDTQSRHQVVWRAFVEPVPDAKGQHLPLYPSDKDVRDLDSVTFDALWRLYLEHQEAKSVAREIPPESIATMVEGIRRNPKRAADEFSQMPHETLVLILTALAASPPT